MRVRGLLLLSFGVVSACEESAIVDAGSRADRAPIDGAAADVIAMNTSDTGTMDVASPPSCRVAPVAGALELTPQSPLAGASLRLTASDTRSLTNVELELCSTRGARGLTLSGLDAMGSPIRWWWDAERLEAGSVQAIFRADPGRTVYATREFTVGAAMMDAGVRADATIPSDAGGAHSDLCAAPAGNLLGARGGFEMGLAGNAPIGWEVRSAAMLSARGGSGAPSQHMFSTDPAPGCAGRALAVDARGQWDCYAIQTVTDYNSIIGGRRYRITASVRSRGNAPRGAICPECVAAWFIVGAQWVDGSDRFFGDEKNPRPATAAGNDFDWRVLSWEIIAPPEARRVLLWLTAHHPGRVDFDNVSITLVP
jgi:hypothetical protein